ncbi:1117_t:CDS:2 [Entrophospora sp. SA101]|nr:1117_t:CDS:2 [Entrophospora sp. SA101]
MSVVGFSLVSFGAKQRYLGEAAKTQEISNFKNTVASLKRLAGRTYLDKEIQDIEKQFINADLVDAKGQVGVKVQYLGEEKIFSATQMISMYFTKLKEITTAELKIPISDVVISVPGWFTDVQRRSILDAAEVAGLNCLRLMNDTTASALGYGITKPDLPEDKPRNVVIVDIGHSTYSVAIVAFIKGQLTVKSTAYDRNFGGRNFDQLLVDHFAEVFREKYKIDVKSNQRALFRLRTAAEKLKKVLSANLQAPISVESIMNDVDVQAIYSRQEFEELSKDLLDQVIAPLKQALEDSELTLDDIHSVEVVGGSSRIPAIKERISKFFGKELNFTLNQDEAVARGCAFQCAMLSPAFKVRDFSIQDITAPYPIKISWEKIPEIPDEESELVVFPKFNPIPSTKILTFFRKEPFTIEAHYAEPDNLPPGINSWIGSVTVKNVQPMKNDDLSMVKVKVRLNIHGVLSVESAYLAEEVIREEKEEQPTPKKEESEAQQSQQQPPQSPPSQPQDQSQPQPMDTDTKPEETTTPTPKTTPTKKLKKVIKKDDLPIVAGHGGLDKSAIVQLKEYEGQMMATDKLVADTETQKNALEEYVYDMRSKVESIYSEFVNPSDKDKFIQSLNETENWLYDEGEDATKSVYVEKLEGLKKYGGPIASRYREAEELPNAVKSLRDNIESFMLNSSNNDEKFSHIPDEEKKGIFDRAQKASDWLNEKLEAQSKVPKHEQPIIYSRDILKEREVQTPKTETSGDDTNNNATTKGEQTPESTTSTEGKKLDAGQGNMDLEKLTKEELARKKKLRRKTNEKRQKNTIKMQLKMITPVDIALEDSINGGDDSLFDLKLINKTGAIDNIRKE